MRSRFDLSEHILRMEAEQLKKTVDALRGEYRRRRGRPRLGWVDRVNRDLAGFGEEWRTRERERDIGESRRQ